MSVPTRTITGVTTIFTPPADCKSSWTFEAQSYNSVTNGLLIQNLNQGGFAKSCFPPSFSGYGRAASFVQVYSPYLCPDGYATPGEFNAGGTTTGICCPSGYRYGSTYSSINYFGSSSVLFMGCISTYSGVTTVPARAANTDLTNTVVTGPLTLWGQPITIQYQQQDLIMLGVSSTTTTSSSSSSSSSSPSMFTTNINTVPTASSLTSPSPIPSPMSTELSPGAKAAIGIALTLTVLLILGVAVFFVMKRKRARLRQPPPSQYPHELDKTQLTELQDTWAGRGPKAQYYAPYSELDGRAIIPMRHMNELE